MVKKKDRWKHAYAYFYLLNVCLRQKFPYFKKRYADYFQLELPLKNRDGSNTDNADPTRLIRILKGWLLSLPANAHHSG